MTRRDVYVPPRWGIWQVWLPAATLIVTFAGTVLFLHWRILNLQNESGGSEGLMRDTYLTGVCLVGLALLFILHTAWKYQQLLALHRHLQVEAAQASELREQAAALETLLETATQLNVQPSVTQVAEVATLKVAEALGAHQASIMLFNPETNLLETRATAGEDTELAARAAQPLVEGIAGWVARHREAVLLNPGLAHPDLERYFNSQRNISSALSAPITCGEECLGVLNVNRLRDAHRFTEDQRRSLERFAQNLGSVIHRAKVLQTQEAMVRRLEDGNKKLQELNKVKDAFLSTASHELKTPLTTIIGYSEILNTHDDRLAPDQRREFLNRLRAESRGLLGIIEGILDLSRLETGKSPLHCETTSLNDVAHSAVETVQSLAVQEQITVLEAFDRDLAPVSLDEVKMRQVLVNLLVNAIRYSPEGATVRIHTSRVGNGVEVSVADRGPGIAPEDRERIFALFGQGIRQGTKNTTGLGIGLHLVKRIVELHQGEVGVESTVGEGSRFYVRLPGAEAESAGERAAA